MRNILDDIRCRLSLLFHEHFYIVQAWGYGLDSTTDKPEMIIWVEEQCRECGKKHRRVVHGYSNMNHFAKVYADYQVK